MFASCHVEALGFFDPAIRAADRSEKLLLHKKAGPEQDSGGLGRRRIVGSWGIGLYSNDFSQDLRSSVKAVARLPFEPGRLLDHLCSVERSAANDARDPDHTVFWLVVADQFAARGIDCPRARERALEIISAGTDLAAMQALGMDPKSLAKRRIVLEALGARLAAPTDPAKKRAVLKTPQRLLLEVGEIVIYPVCKGKPINPYAVGKEWAWVKAWQQDRWGALVITERGHMFDFLAWYRPLVINDPLAREPSLEELMATRSWVLRNPGTLTARHLANMQMRSLGRIAIDPERFDRCFAWRPSPLRCVVSDISLCNNMGIHPLGAQEAHRVRHGYPPTPRIERLSEIVADA